MDLFECNVLDALLKKGTNSLISVMPPLNSEHLQLFWHHYTGIPEKIIHLCCLLLCKAHKVL